MEAGCEMVASNPKCVRKTSGKASSFERFGLPIHVQRNSEGRSIADHAFYSSLSDL